MGRAVALLDVNPALREVDYRRVRGSGNERHWEFRADAFVVRMYDVPEKLSGVAKDHESIVTERLLRGEGQEMKFAMKSVGWWYGRTNTSCMNKRDG